MSERRDLPDPIGPLLQDAADEVTVQRIWSGVRARRATPVPGVRRSRRLWVGGGVLVAAAALIGLSMFPSGEVPGPLRREDGSALGSTLVAANHTRVALSDSSTLGLGAGARLEVLESSGTSFTTLLRQGRARFDVQPGGPRRWIIECGLLSVEVVGTSFTIARGTDWVSVEVRHGVVLVRSEHVADRVRRLGAGQSIVVRADRIVEPATPPSVAESAVARQRVEPPVASPVVPAPAQAALEPTWRRAAARGDFRGAYSILGADGLAAETRRAGVRELLALADVARLGGHPAEAVAPLERILEEWPRDPQASVAAFTLGRLQLDTLGDAERAGAAFDRAVELGLPAALREDAHARRVEAWHRAGRAERARDAAADYLAAFPEGRHRAAVERWTGP